MNLNRSFLNSFLFISLLIFTLFGCNIGVADDDEAVPTTGEVTLSGNVEFPATAGTVQGSIKAAIKFSDYRIFINDKEVTLLSDGSFTGTVPTADQYEIEVRFKNSNKPVLKAYAATGASGIIVNVETTSHALSFDSYREQAGKSSTKYADFSTILPPGSANIKELANAIEEALKKTSNVASEIFDVTLDDEVKKLTQNAVDTATGNAPFATTTTSSTTSTTTTTSTSATTTTSTGTGTGTTTASKPSATLAINDGAATTNSTNVTLNLLDVQGVGVITMSVESGAYEILDQAKSWTLSSGDGSKTVSLVLKDGNGNLSDTISDSITLDTTLEAAPTVFITDNHGSALVRDANTVTLKATFTSVAAIDENTPPTITIGNLVTNGAMTKVSNLVWTYAWNVPSANDGVATITITAKNSEGTANSAATGSTTYTIDNTAPTITTGTLALNNAYMDLGFSEGVYGTSSPAAALATADLSLVFSQNGDDITAVAIRSLKKNDNASETSASALAGGESTIRAFLTLTPPASACTGLASVTIKAASSNAIYDLTGNSSVATTTTGAKALYNQNLLQNNDSGFESYSSATDANWTELGTVSGVIANSTVKKVGTQSCELENPTTAYSGRGIRSAAVTAVPGQDYSFSAWLYVASETVPVAEAAAIASTDIQLVVSWGVSTSTQSVQHLSAYDTWQKISYNNITAPGGATTVSLSIQARETDNNNNDVHIDDVRIVLDQ
ncbi:hypothetical protein ACFL35_10120 [Candidatus Riflebacteria bacterium]